MTMPNNSRRAFLGGSVAMIAASATALPIAVSALPAAPDPIIALLEARRVAEARFAAALLAMDGLKPQKPCVEVGRFSHAPVTDQRDADGTIHITAPASVPDPEGEPRYAYSLKEIRRNAPKENAEEWIAARSREFRAAQRRCARANAKSGYTALDRVADRCHDEWSTIGERIIAADLKPQSVAGLSAMLAAVIEDYENCGGDLTGVPEVLLYAVHDFLKTAAGGQA